jgi:iron complex outermembrane receptor protein
VLFDKKLEWTTGAYRYDAKSRLGGYVTLPAFAIILPNFNQNDRFETESSSAFVHGIYHVTDPWSVTAGVRYTDEKKRYAFDHSPYLFVPSPLDYGSSHTDWKFSTDYRLSPEVMVYASAATGFRSDGSQPRPFTVGQQKEKVPAEELISYEVGLKTDLFDRRLRINLALFQDDYDPRVVVSAGTQCTPTNSVDPGPVVRGLIGNACPPGTPLGAFPAPGNTGSPWLAYASAPGKDRGAELEVTASPIENLDINATFAYFEFESGAPATINGQPNNVYVHPSFKVQAPISGSLGVQYRFPLFGGSFTPRLDWFYQGYRSNGVSYLAQLPGSENRVPGYGLMNARLTYTPEGAKWDVSLQAENLLDKFYWYQLGPVRSNNPATGFGITDNRTGAPGRPREVSLSFRRNFQ